MSFLAWDEHTELCFEMKHRSKLTTGPQSPSSVWRVGDSGSVTPQSVVVRFGLPPPAWIRATSAFEAIGFSPQYMLAVLQSSDGPLGMKTVGQGL